MAAILAFFLGRGLHGRGLHTQLRGLISVKSFPSALGIVLLASKIDGSIKSSRKVLPVVRNNEQV